MFDDDDPEMQGAYEKARATFKYFWREVAWERRERKEHDDAWGMNFGDPHKIRVVPEQKKWSGFLKSLLGGRGNAIIQEHPMSEAMGPSLKQSLEENPSMVDGKDENGWTLLHHQALAGSAATVQVLLEAGADKNAVTNQGMTPLQLGKSLGWERVVALLHG